MSRRPEQSIKGSFLHPWIFFEAGSSRRDTLSGKRWDIQVLRGWAVTLVVLYHADLAFPSGFLGVDAFLVISGYLITGGILSRLNKLDFSISQFYLRRALRLLPAAYAVFVLVAVASPWFLNTQEAANVSTQILASVAFAANFYFKQEVDYFGTTADTMPLLHIWSLSLEQQFYFILPLGLIALRPKNRIVAIWLAFGISLALCFSHAFSARTTFFMLPTRIWELAIGALAFIYQPKSQPNWAILLRYCSAALLIAAPSFQYTDAQPGIAALIVTASTAVLLSLPVSKITIVLMPLAAIGEFSYSLYLVHWPIIVGMQQVWLTPIHTLVGLGAVIVSLAIGFVVYQLVEIPFQRPRSPWFLIISGSAAAITATVAVLSTSTTIEKFEKPSHGLAIVCEEDGRTFLARPECSTSATPRTIIWGDSFAMHLVPGIIALNPNLQLVQATKSVCGPTPGLGPYELRGTSSRDQRWARKCISFNSSVLDYIERTPSIETVVLSTQVTQYLRAGWGTVQEGVPIDQRGAFVESITKLADLLGSWGKQVVFVTPPPSAYFNIQSCVERNRLGGISFGPGSSCEIDVRDYRLRDRDVEEAISAIEQKSHVRVVRLAQAFCGASTCETAIDNRPLFADRQHLTELGSRYAMSKLRFDDLLDGPGEQNSKH